MGVILFPCRKCIVKSCCTEACDDYEKINKIVSKITFPFNMLIELYRVKDWGLLVATCLFCGSFITVSVGLVKMFISWL